MKKIIIIATMSVMLTGCFWGSSKLVSKPLTDEQLLELKEDVAIKLQEAKAKAAGLRIPLEVRKKAKAAADAIYMKIREARKSNKFDIDMAKTFLEGAIGQAKEVARVEYNKQMKKARILKKQEYVASKSIKDAEAAYKRALVLWYNAEKAVNALRN